LPMVFIVVTACTLMGERFPEFDAWLEDSKNDQEFRRKGHQDHPIPAAEDFEDDEFGLIRLMRISFLTETGLRAGPKFARRPKRSRRGVVRRG
jgi:hypothetical protein